MKVQIYNNTFGFNQFLICTDNKEIFFNNAFESVKIALICLEKNSIDRKEVWHNTIKGSLFLEQDLSMYVMENQDLLNDIKKQLEIRNLDYSWLQIMQLMVLNNKENDIDVNINHLHNFYEKNIMKEFLI